MPRKGRDEWLCVGCDVDTGKIKEYYMLWDHIWERVANSSYGMLCIGCVEERLGRKLTPGDFNNSYLNWGVGVVEKSMRLADRQGLLRESRTEEPLVSSDPRPKTGGHR